MLRAYTTPETAQANSGSTECKRKRTYTKKKTPCVPKDQGTQGVQKEETIMNASVFYMIGFALTMILLSLAEGLYRYVGARR